jgi:hypothetical protein
VVRWRRRGRLQAEEAVHRRQASWQADKKLARSWQAGKLASWQAGCGLLSHRDGGGEPAVGAGEPDDPEQHHPDAHPVTLHGDPLSHRLLPLAMAAEMTAGMTAGMAAGRKNATTSQLYGRAFFFSRFLALGAFRVNRKTD